MAPLQSLLLVLLHCSWVSSTQATNTGMGLSHSSSGAFGTETLSGKNKVPIISFSFSLYPMNQDSYSDKIGLVVLSHD